MKGTCRSSFLNISPAGSMEECIIFGKSTQQCSHVSWHQADNLCLAYSNCEIIDASELLSSSVDCEVCLVSGLCHGNVVEHFIVAEEDCPAKCKDEERCSWYSYIGELKTCVLLADCVSLDFSSTTSYSSMKHCNSSLAQEQSPPLHQKDISQKQLSFFNSEVPKLRSLNYKVALKWGKHLSDLDIHMLRYKADGSGQCLTHHGRKTGCGPTLDTDSGHAGGPETITWGESSYNYLIYAHKHSGEHLAKTKVRIYN